MFVVFLYSSILIHILFNESLSFHDIKPISFIILQT